ncbi:pyroglutamyl-peptidase I [Bacillus pinisoli]|uniref:pyroglutamyl-peptidase I n=1 Tax=Bacillus pinisoli TaxID=2901866 RepID=UPI001FF1F7CE|nr:pyroglutamyl-peptidase I [Bacillus pinisoli]
MKKLLLTGFVPFLEFRVNPTEEIAKALDGKVIGDYEVVGRVLPVEFSQTAVRAIELYEEVQPDVVIHLGLAGGRSKITPERIAINCSDGAADNSGVVLEDATIKEDGPDGYFSTLPIRKFVNVLKENNLPATISNSAGTYLCNFVMYNTLHYIQQQGKQTRAGFVHIPASHELSIQQPSVPSWSQQDLQRGIELMIQSLD